MIKHTKAMLPNGVSSFYAVTPKSKVKNLLFKTFAQNCFFLYYVSEVKCNTCCIITNFVETDKLICPRTSFLLIKQEFKKSMCYISGSKHVLSKAILMILIELNVCIRNSF